MSAVDVMRAMGRAPYVLVSLHSAPSDPGFRSMRSPSYVEGVAGTGLGWCSVACNHRWMVEAVLLDFYGTVVHEDDVMIEQICAAISSTAAAPASPKEVSRHWWTVFAAAFESSHGDGFRTQRSIELESLASTIEHFGARCDADQLSGPLFEFWERPPAFDDALTFLGVVDVPIVVVSNIDRADIEAAIEHHGLTFEAVITSEDVRSYKPRPELFNAGLDAAGYPADRVLHVGDSLTSDVAGAHRLGIPVAWVNRRGKPSPDSDPPAYEVTNLNDLAITLFGHVEPDQQR